MGTVDAEDIINTLLSSPSFSLRPLHLGQTPPTDQQVRETVSKTLQTTPDIFLEKWGKFLSVQQLRYFDTFADRYEVKFHLDQLRKGDQPPSKAQIRNRRRAYLEQHRDSDYFSDEAYESRQPELYEEYIGQHIPISERTAPFDDDMTLVDRILHNIDRQRHIDALESARRDAEESFQEFDTDEEDEGAMEEHAEEKKKPSPPDQTTTDDENLADHNTSEPEPEPEPGLSAEEREELRQEFHAIMDLRFVEGKETDFDYSLVDNNSMYDNTDAARRDIDDAYFDAEEANPQGNSKRDLDLDDELEDW